VKRRFDPGHILSSTPLPASGRRYAGSEAPADDNREEFVVARSGSGAGTTMLEEVIREVPSLGVTGSEIPAATGFRPRVEQMCSTERPVRP
jgi:hypothetical protein